jgi:hypothetical protein
LKTVYILFTGDTKLNGYLNVYFRLKRFQTKTIGGLGASLPPFFTACVSVDTDDACHLCSLSHWKRVACMSGYRPYGLIWLDADIINSVA